MVSSVSVVEPEISSPPVVDSLAWCIDDHGPYDISRLFDLSKSIDDIITSVKKLSNGTKYSLFYNHVKPIKVSTLSHGVNRKFNYTWLKTYPCLLYSPKLDGVFCYPCFLLHINSQRKDKGYFSNKPFSNWTNTYCSLSNYSKLTVLSWLIPNTWCNEIHH